MILIGGEIDVSWIPTEEAIFYCEVCVEAYSAIVRSKTLVHDLSHARGAT